MTEIIRILVDMDGVLVDFDEGVCMVHHFHPSQLHESRQPGEWYLPTIFARMRGEIMSVEEFWRPIIERKDTFWQSLRPCRWYNDLINLVNDADKEWHVISDPGPHPSGYSGKLQWLRDRLGREFNRYIPTPHKHVCAYPGVLLIDDREDNVKKFILAGGHAILFPTQGNSLHQYADDPVSYVKEKMKDYTW